MKTAKIISVKKGALPIIFEVSVLFFDTGEEEKYSLIESEWAESGYGVGDELSEDDLLFFEASAEVTKAAVHGLRLLGYSDASVRALSQKLRTKGYDRDIAERAAIAIEAAGYIKEEETVLRRGDRIAETKLRGKRRVAEELAAAGYKREYISEWSKTTEVDFAEICARAITKKGGIPEASDRDGRRKLLSYLYRQGFSSDDIRGAIEIL